MKNQSSQRGWVLALGAALLLMAAANPGLRYANNKIHQQAASLSQIQQGLTQSLQQLRSDAATVQKLSHNMNEAEAERYLAVVDRLEIAALLEPLARAARLSKFTYILSPEERLKPAGIDSGDIARSLLSIAAEAPQDDDIYQFIADLQQVLPGRLQIQRLEIERLPPVSDVLAGSNIKFTAQLEWLSNGSQRTAQR